MSGLVILSTGKQTIIMSGLVVRRSWGTDECGMNSSTFKRVKEKLKHLKNDIKEWRDARCNRNTKVITQEISEIDREIAEAGGNNDLFERRRELVSELNRVEHYLNLDLRQKAKVKWSVDGDENSRFFHALINYRRRSGMINGIKHNGRWIDNPDEIKGCFHGFYLEKFKKFDGMDFELHNDQFNKLSMMQAICLEAPFSMEEIKTAVWNCGGEKAPGPDGFTFAFIKNYWEIVKMDFFDMMDEFFMQAQIPKGCNSSFITLIPKAKNPNIINDYRPISLIGVQYKVVSKVLANRLSRVIDSIISPEQSAFIKGRQILDGPLLISEIISWYKTHRKNLLMFKIDFAKAYDSVSWEYLTSILRAMGFGNKWIAWMEACMYSARSSILINGSPTEEIQLQRGLRQGDPMAPFLFIVAMEGLHVALENLTRRGDFSGANINNLCVSHLFYADDAMVIGEWSESNMETITNALRFFQCVSGLKINFEKSSLIGIGPSREDVDLLARRFGCKSQGLPFKYLGIPIGGRLGSISLWEPIIDKFKNKLSTWKSGLLSMGGRATLISAVLGALGIYFLSLFRAPKKVIFQLESMRSGFLWGFNGGKRKMAWIRWQEVIADKEDGGLGFGGLESMNLALLYKWRWRGLNNPNNLWVKVLRAVHGFNCFYDMTASTKGIWSNIVKSNHKVHDLANEVKNWVSKKVGDGMDTSFWHDQWVGNTNLASRFPRLYALEQVKQCKISDRFGNNEWVWEWSRPIRSGRVMAQFNELIQVIPKVLNCEEKDKWIWTNGKNSFSLVAQIRKVVQCNLARSPAPKKTVWIPLVPKKINVFMWRVLRDCIPTYPNLFARGIDVQTMRCLFCNNGIETSNHIFKNCILATETRVKIRKWTRLNLPVMNPKDTLDWIDGLKLRCKMDLRLKAIMFIWWWSLWKARNNWIHNKCKEKSEDLFSVLMATSHLWVTNRSKKHHVSWQEWVDYPLN